MKVDVTSYLEEQFQVTGRDLTLFKSEFSNWKSDPSGEYAYHFGKDALNIDSRVLRHVHMIPLNSPEALLKWDEAYEDYKPQTSDRYLFYSDRGRSHYLLVAIVDDPGGHAIWKQRNLVKQWEEIADDFYNLGKVA